MPPRRFSRHTFSTAFLDDSDELVLTESEPFRYKEFDDNRLHIVKAGETIYSIAAHYFKGLARPAGLYWIIADFQEDPIHDPTVDLEPGRTLVIPSVRTVIEEIFSEDRRDE